MLPTELLCQRNKRTYARVCARSNTGIESGINPRILSKFLERRKLAVNNFNRREKMRGMEEVRGGFTGK